MKFGNASVTRRHALTSLSALLAATATPLAVRAATAVPDNSGDILLGQTAQLSGPLAPTFVAVLKGQELALKEVNDKGGIGGRRVKLITLDDGYDTKKVIENVTKLIDEHKVTALFGLASTAGVAGSLPILLDRKVPLIGVYTGSPGLRVKQHPYFFTTSASYRDEIVEMMRNQVTLMRSRVGVLYNNSPFGKLMLPVVEEVAKEQGVTIVSKVSLEMSGADAMAAAQSLAAERPQAIIMLAFGPSIVPFIKAARTLIAAQIYCLAIANSKPLLAALGEQARGLAYTESVPYPFRAVSPLNRDFTNSMRAAGLGVDYDHMFGYLNMRTLLAILKHAGKSVTPQGLVSTIQGMKDVDIGGYVLNFSPTNHHGSKFVETVVVGQGGRYLR